MFHIFWLRWLGLRRQVYELTERDLRRFPLWEHALDEEGLFGQDEATVRPVRRSAIPREGWGIYPCASKAQLADGRVLPCYVTFVTPHDLSTPVDDGGHDLSSLQPNLVVAGHQFGFWFGNFPPPPAASTALYEALGCSAEQVFPIRIEASLAFEGEEVRRTVRVNGFQHRSGKVIVETQQV